MCPRNITTDQRRAFSVVRLVSWLAVIAACVVIGIVGWSRYSSGEKNGATAGASATIALSEGAVEASEEAFLNQQRAEALATLQDDAVGWFERVEAVRELPEWGIDEATLAALYGYLRREAEQRPEDWYVVANEIMEVLRKQNIDPDSYSEEMLRLIGNVSVPAVTRDYAIQHVAQWIAHPDQDLAIELDDAKKDAVFRSVLTELAAEKNRDLDLVGTGLTALATAMEHGEFRQPETLAQELSELVLAIARGEHASSSVNRLTALQVAAEMHLPETAGLCRDILEASLESEAQASDISFQPTSADVRLSAVAALGLTGEAADLTLLNSVAEHDDALSYAAKAAVKRIEGREPHS